MRPVTSEAFMDMGHPYISKEYVDRLIANNARLIKVGHKHGWNGVENSKILATFFDELIAELIAERDQLRNVCGEAYQMAGALGASTEAMDNLLAASEGDPLPHTTFLPHPASDVESSLSAEVDRKEAE